MSILVIVPISPIFRLYSTLLDSTLRLLYLSLLYLTSLDLTLLYKQLAVVVVVLNDRLLPTPTYSHLLPPAPTCSHLLPTSTCLYGLLMATPRGLPRGGNPWQTRGGRPLAPAASCFLAPTVDPVTRPFRIDVYRFLPMFRTFLRE